MLILSRRASETICIGNDIFVTVLSCEKGNVRIGIEAPKDVEVDREEIRRRKMAGRSMKND
jgi:carbon storage regulator